MSTVNLCVDSIIWWKLALFCLHIQHPLIAEFPSKNFYDGKLMTAPNHECRGIRLLSIWRRQVPLMFCHVEGAEKALTVSTAEGNEHSQSNDAERDEAVSIQINLKFMTLKCCSLYTNVYMYV